MTSTVNVDVTGRTDVGLVRRRNEDAIYTGRSLFAVADGLGGHPAGDIASATVIEALQPHDRLVDPSELSPVLGRAVMDANEALRRKIETEPELAGMAATLVAMLWSGATAIVANLGDSRAYLLRDAGSGSSRTIQITEDHIYGHLVADAADVPDLPERLSRFLDGRVDGRSPDLTTWDLRVGDRFMLCSDGLTAVVTHDLIHSTLNSSGGPDETADRLVALAIGRGGPDNVTVIVVDVRAA